MKHTLLLRLVGPMQSWGVQSDFTYRDTGLEPSKSGVIGLLCAALGKPRNEAHPANADKPSLIDLAQLRMGVRVDREGVLKNDFHTAKDVMTSDGKPFKSLKSTELSHRFYLADAAFLVGFEGDDPALLHRLHAALRSPHWFLFLGRKSFVPSEPIWLKNAVKEATTLEDALCLHQRLKPKRNRFDDDRMRLVIEDNYNGAVIHRDCPISFVKGARDFSIRRVSVDYCADQPLLQDLEV
jgi:CRISPR system Cascade subunit CasD